MTDTKGRRDPPSDLPAEDLMRERDAFIQQFFRKGAQFTEELLRENERLRERISQLEADGQKLRAHLASETAIRELLTKIELLEKEKEDLVSRSVAIAAESGEFSSRYGEVEGELANLANLYVSTTQLHGSRSVRHTLRILKELLAQLLGAGGFAIYFISDDAKELVSLASEGMIEQSIARLSASDGIVGRAFSTATLFLAEGDTSKGTIEAPVAAIPLLLENRAVGAIAIFHTLPQKTQFVPSDAELFKLLGAHAAPAIVHARLFTDAKRKLPSIQAFVDLED